MRRIVFFLCLSVFISQECIVYAQSGDQASSTQAAASPEEKSYVLPAFEIIGFEILLNQFNRHFASDEEDYDTDFETIEDNFHRGWNFDRDSFNINQIGHPYQGSIYFGLARTNGLNFWESMAYTTVGSAIWEIAGETTEPSINDQLTTTFGGSFLGEALFRTVETFWKSAGGEKNAPVSEDIGAAVASPGTAINRAALGKPPQPEVVKTRPDVFAQFQVGYLRYEDIFNAFDSDSIDRNLAMGRFDIQYGLPGRSGYSYERPFDYFDLDVALSSSSNDPLNRMIINGLLAGSSYAIGERYHGIWGIYGNYNYLAPEIFRVGSSAVSLGTTGRWLIDDNITMQGYVLGGVGFGAGGTIHETEEGRNNHYGAVPQALVAMKMLLQDTAWLELAAQDFVVTGSAAESDSDTENIARLQVALGFRVYGPHALALQFEESHRVALSSRSDDEHQRIETLGVFYTYIWKENQRV